MKELINAINTAGKNMAQGRLNCDMVRDIPQDRFSLSPYVFTIAFDIIGMDSIQKLSTIFYCIFLILSYFIFGVTGAIYYFIITGLMVLWSTAILYNRKREMADKEYPFKKLIDDGEFEIESPYIVSKSKAARDSFKHVILYTHYLFDNTLYETLQKSMASVSTALCIVTMVVVAMLLSVPSYGLAYAFLFYFASRCLYEVVRVKYTRLMIEIVKSFNEAANEQDEIKEP